MENNISKPLFISFSAAAKKEAVKARAGPEGETSFPYGVNKNFLAP